MTENTLRFRPYNHPAGGWGAAAATAKVLLQQSVITKGSRALLAMNQPGGFKCPSCAFPDPDCRRTLEFCENGAKALAFEATRRRVTREFFQRRTVSELMAQSDHWLEMQGRLTEPMRYDAASDGYVPCDWDEAFALIGRHLRSLESPHQAEFYTSGRTSNEAAFLYSIFVREFGTNNFPDCSNMCHEPTSRGLPPSIGVGKGTVVMEDFEHAEAIFVIGQNTGTNSPRMMTNLVEARKRGVPIVAVNPMPERALIRFTAPQDIMQMATFGSTPIASEFVHIRIGGDLALFKGMMKAMFERENQGEEVIDRNFIRRHTVGLEAVRDEVLGHDWAAIVEASGVSEEQIRRVAEIYVRSRATMLCYGMGLTQHQEGSRLLQQAVNLLLLRGNFGKPGAGIAPIRGHSNVQGDRTVGIDEKPSQAYLDRLREVFGFEPPREPGHHAVESVEAMQRGTAKVFIGMGGKLRARRPRHGTILCGNAQARIDRRRGDEVEPRPSRSWTGCAHPAGHLPFRDDTDGGGRAIHHDRGLGRQGDRLPRRIGARQPSSAPGGRDRLPHGARHVAEEQGSVEKLHPRLPSHSRQDRRGVSGDLR